MENLLMPALERKEKIKLLLVEGLDADADIFHSKLQGEMSAQEGTYQITHVNLVDDAVKALLKQPFDIMVSGLNLPGSERSKVIKALVDNKSDIPFIVMSDNYDESQAKEMIQLGADDYIDKRDYPSEKGLKRILAMAIERYGLKKQLHEMMAAQKKIADTDYLTGLPNRMAFLEKFTYTLALSKRSKSQFAFMFVDLNNFKIINDSLGHHEGDLVLKKAAKVMLSHIRESDMLARFGGDEFVLILNNLACQSDAYQVANKLSNALKHSFSKYKSYDLSASFGIALYPADAQLVDDLIRQADIAMYSAKRSKTHVSIYSNNIQFKDKIRARISLALNQTHLESDRILLYKQPVYSFENGTKDIAFYEVCSKLFLDKRVIEPQTYFPHIENTELIERYDYHLLNEVCKLISTDKATLFALNISEHTFRERYFIQEVEKILRQHGVSGEHLIFEVTEQSILNNSAQAEDTLRELKRNNISLAIDDFGSGYASLSHLFDLQVDYVKIDKAHISDEGHSEKVQAIFSAMYHFGKGMGIKIIPEGVESEEELEMLQEIGFGYAQGYFLGRPMPIENIEDE